MTIGTEELLAILRVGHETTIRGAGRSLREALQAAHYAERRAGFGPADLRPLDHRSPGTLGVLARILGRQANQWRLVTSCRLERSDVSGMQ